MTTRAMKRLLFLGFVFAIFEGTQSYKRVCYFTNWVQYRSFPMTYTADNVDPFLCTHIMYAFGKVVGNNIDAYEWNDKGTGGQYEKIMKLRTVNPHLRILLAIGGWTHGTAPFTAVVDDPNDMAAFATNALTYLKTYNFDGLDLDWEYPGGNGSPPEDKQRFTSFVQKLRQVFDDDGVTNNVAPMLLTAAVAAGKNTIDNAYEVGLISQNLDFINLMSYDLHGSWEAATGHHSALYARSDEVGTAAYMNVDYAVNYWITLGAPADKLVLGLALYGRSFTLASPSSTGPGAPATGAGLAGTYTGEAGLLAYYEACQNLNFNGWTRHWHNEHKVPYAYKGSQWIGYDDVDSFNVKIDYIIAKGLGGGMVWSLDQDDFSNSCGHGPYPLMNVLRSRLSGITMTSTQAPLSSTAKGFQTSTPATSNHQTSSLSTSDHQISTLPTSDHQTSSLSTSDHQISTLPTSNNQTSTMSTSNHETSSLSTSNHQRTSSIASSSGSSSCGAPQPCVDGQLYGDSCDIHKYYQCASGVAYEFRCATGTVWDDRINNCNWDYLVLTSPTPCGCGPPATCTDGQFYEDKCDMTLYYQCAHGIPYPYQCHAGTVWDIAISNCNWDYAVPSRAPPTGSDCTGYVSTTQPQLPSHVTTETSTQNAARITSTTNEITTNTNSPSASITLNIVHTTTFTSSSQTIPTTELPSASGGTTLKTLHLTTTVPQVSTKQQQQFTTQMPPGSSYSTLSEVHQHPTTQPASIDSNGLLSQAPQQTPTSTTVTSSDNTQQIRQQTPTPTTVTSSDNTQLIRQQTPTPTTVKSSDNTQQIRQQTTSTTVTSSDNTQQLRQQTPASTTVTSSDNIQQLRQQTTAFSTIAASNSMRSQAQQHTTQFSGTSSTNTHGLTSQTPIPTTAMSQKITTDFAQQQTSSKISTEVSSKPSTEVSSKASSETSTKVSTETKTTTPPCGPPYTCPFPAWDSGSSTLSVHVTVLPFCVVIAAGF